MCSWGRLAERLWKHPEGLWAGWAGSRQEGGEGRSDSGHNLKVGLVGLAGKLDGDEEREELMTGCGCVPETNGGLDRGLVPMDLTCLLHAQTEIGESSSVLPRLPPPGRPGRPGTLVPQTDGSARFDVCPFARCRQAEADGEAGNAERPDPGGHSPAGSPGRTGSIRRPCPGPGANPEVLQSHGGGGR